MDRETVRELCQAIQACLPKAVRFDVLETSLLQLLGVNLTPAQWRDVSTRLAGNVGRLAAGEPVGPWMSQDVLEWALLEITQVTRVKSTRKGRACRLAFRVLTGSATGLDVDRIFSYRHLAFLARQAGFTGRRGKRPWLSQPAELVRLRLWGGLDPLLTRDGRPGFHHIRLPAGLVKQNVQLLKMRLLPRNPPCPRNYRWACHACVIGYDQCVAGTHPTTYRQQICAECKQEQLHDPSRPGRCLTCWKRRAAQRE